MSTLHRKKFRYLLFNFTNSNTKYYMKAKIFLNELHRKLLQMTLNDR